MKNSFQSQIDQYNTSIDSKIDNAIASYLAGIKTEKVTELDEYVTKLYNNSKWATTFVNKSSAISGSNNNNFVRGGWWFFYIFGWNTAASYFEGIVNFSGAARGSHQLNLWPSSVDSRKWFVKEVNINGNSYYGPYNNVLYKIEQQVYIQNTRSNWNQGTENKRADRKYSNKTFDLRSLTTPGTINVGSYDCGWTNFENIQGTTLLKYTEFETNKIGWAALNSTGSVETSNTYYCIDYDKQLDLSVNAEDCDLFKGDWGVQFQQWKCPSREQAEMGDEGSVGAMTLQYKKPQVLALNHNQLYNHVASELISEAVPMYAGVPICRIPRSGKIKFKYKIETYNISDNATNTDSVRVVMKINQFGNNDIAADTNILYDKTGAQINNIYTCEFDVNKVNGDGTSILYVKAAPTSQTTYVRFHIVEPPTLTVEQ